MDEQEASQDGDGVFAGPVLCPRFVAPLLRARTGGQSRVRTSLDLGLSEAEIVVGEDGADLPGGQKLGWEQIGRIAEARTSKVGEPCFAVDDAGNAEPIRTYSEATGRQVSLIATATAPTMLIAGFQMHRTTGSDPLSDTREKIAAVAPIRGEVLDTTTGLGYTAIEASRTADHVTTVEIDPAAVEMARFNPWSRALFDARRITRRVADIEEEIRRFPDGSFSCVLHDPPVLALAGELYSLAFYRQLHRVLQPGGRLFHYIGNPDSSSGRRTTDGVVRRLHDAGFARVTGAPRAFGVVARR
ncbi:MAG: methyltransferase domain-containing protein [Actinomycetes bacterium]